jgi:hypothetical protein
MMKDSNFEDGCWHPCRIGGKTRKLVNYLDRKDYVYHMLDASIHFGWKILRSLGSLNLQTEHQEGGLPHRIGQAMLQLESPLGVTALMDEYKVSCHSLPPSFFSCFTQPVSAHTCYSSQFSGKYPRRSRCIRTCSFDIYIKCSYFPPFSWTSFIPGL